MNRQSSRHRDSSDDDGEAADFSPSLHKKEMLDANTIMTMTMMVFFSRLIQRNRPNLIHLLLVTTFKIIKIAKTLSENPPNCLNQMVTRNQSRGSPILPSELLQRLMQLEKEEQAQKSRESRPGSVRSFQHKFDQDKFIRDMLRDKATSRKRSFRAAMSPPLRKVAVNVRKMMLLLQILTGRALLPTQRDRQPVRATTFHGFRWFVIATRIICSLRLKVIS